LANSIREALPAEAKMCCAPRNGYIGIFKYHFEITLSVSDVMELQLQLSINVTANVVIIYCLITSVWGYFDTIQ
jgi:hypothetical protein